MRALYGRALELAEALGDRQRQQQELESSMAWAVRSRVADLGPGCVVA